MNIKMVGYSVFIIFGMVCASEARLLPEHGSGYLYESEKYHGYEPQGIHVTHGKHWPYRVPYKRWYRHRPYYHFNHTHYDHPHRLYHYPHGGFRYICHDQNYGYYYCNYHEYDRYYRRAPYMKYRYWYIYQPFYRRPLYW